jgi:serine/threonine protein kinase
MGMTLYYMLSGDHPYPGFSDSRASKLFIKKGIPPKLKIAESPEYLHKVNPYARVVIKAMNMCLQADPESRPSAREVADFLANAIHELETEQYSGVQ